ncbi:MAG: hypothetical protein ACMG55_13200, partial [Microcoleus sp.]
MKSLKTGLIVVGSAALMLLATYGNTVQATNVTNNPDDSLAQIAAKNSSTAPTLIAATGHSKES